MISFRGISFATGKEQSPTAWETAACRVFLGKCERAMASDREEVYVLRVQDRNLAERLRRILREESSSQQDATKMAIDWDGERPFLG
jgi:hypothetical protein